MNTRAAQNKRLVLETFDTLINKRDYASAEKFWSPHYIQHSAHIEPGRDGLFDLVRTLPPTLKYEPGTIVADGDFVIVHGRFSGFLPVNWIAGRHSSHRGWNAGRALGCDSRRGDPRRVQEQSSDVRHEFSEISRPYQPSMTLRIERYADRGGTTIRLIGRMQAEHVSEVERQIEESGTKVTLDLEEVTLVDVQVVRFLGTCEIRGISILNCSPYITDWIAKERR